MRFHCSAEWRCRGLQQQLLKSEIAISTSPRVSQVSRPTGSRVLHVSHPDRSCTKPPPGTAGREDDLAQKSARPIGKKAVCAAVLPYHRLPLRQGVYPDRGRRHGYRHRNHPRSPDVENAAQRHHRHGSYLGLTRYSLVQCTDAIQASTLSGLAEGVLVPVQATGVDGHGLILAVVFAPSRSHGASIWY